MLYDGIIGSTSLESVEFVLMIPEKVLTIEEIMVHTRAIITARSYDFCRWIYIC